jgi:hypothetical protein
MRLSETELTPGYFHCGRSSLRIAGPRNAEETLNQPMRTIDGCELYGAT